MIKTGLSRIAQRCLSNKVRSKMMNFKTGDQVSVTRKITEDDIEQFIKLSRDDNPIHSSVNSEKIVVHGAFLNSLVSGVIGTRLPGPGTLVVKQELNFPHKCYVGEEVRVTVEMVENRKIMTVKFECSVPDAKKTVLYGDAKLVFSK